MYLMDIISTTVILIKPEMIFVR